MKAKTIDVNEIRKYLEYNPDSGIITWIKSPSRRVKAGSIAGVVDSRGYIGIGFKGKRYFAHRLAMVLHNGEDMPDGMVVDHINHIRTDNRIVNLRVVSNRENLSNREKPGTSRYPGVSWDKSSKKWLVMIRIGDKRIYLGRFKHEEEAAAVYQEALLDIC